MSRDLILCCCQHWSVFSLNISQKCYCMGNLLSLIVYFACSCHMLEGLVSKLIDWCCTYKLYWKKDWMCVHLHDHIFELLWSQLSCSIYIIHIKHELSFVISSTCKHRIRKFCFLYSILYSHIKYWHLCIQCDMKKIMYSFQLDWNLIFNVNAIFFNQNIVSVVIYRSSVFQPTFQSIDLQRNVDWSSEKCCIYRTLHIPCNIFGQKFFFTAESQVPKRGRSNLLYSLNFIRWISAHANKCNKQP